MVRGLAARYWVLTALALAGCGDDKLSEPRVPASHWPLRSDSANVAVLQFNRQTYALEDGSLRRFARCQSCDLDSLPLSFKFDPPIDVGWCLFRYVGTQDTVFYGTEIWMGSGEVLVPPTWLPPDSFAAVAGVLRTPLSVTYYRCQATDPQVDTLWRAARKVDITRDFSRQAYRVGIFLYTPEAYIDGVQKWIVFLYAGNQPP